MYKWLVAIGYTNRCVQIFQKKICRNPTQFCRNLRSSKVMVGENPSYRLGILFCTRSMYKFVHIALCTKFVWKREQDWDNPLLHHASGSLDVEHVISVFWVKKRFRLSRESNPSHRHHISSSYQFDHISFLLAPFIFGINGSALHAQTCQMSS